MSDEQLSNRVRSWLLRQPRPTRLHVVTTSGEERDVSIGSSPRWRNVADDVLKLSPARIEALTDDGDVLRVETLDDAASSQPAEQHGTEIPIPTVLRGDPETVRLTHFANLLARAHENSNEFVRSLMELQIARTDRLEERLKIKEAEAEAEFRARMEEQMSAMPEDASKDDLMRHFFGAYMRAKEERQQPAPKASNGAAQHAEPPEGWGG